MGAVNASKRGRTSIDARAGNFLVSCMPPTRSTTDRRRRVLYSAHHDRPTASTASSRREVQRLREARRPTARYAQRVQRRLEGRWFSLVPVGRRGFAVVASVITMVTLVFVGMHFLAVTWPWLAHAPELARPFRLDRADSFGRWYLSMLLAGSAGVSLLTYQLRRYRIDDYRGHYRLWRTVLMVLVVASVGVSVSLVSWTGGLLDIVIGKRVALAGADWVRLVVSIGGAVLVLRLIAETHRSRFSLFALLFASLALAIPEAAGWNLFVVDTPTKWVAITAAPLVGCTALFLSLGAYLRTLYREVCEIEAGPTLRDHFSGIGLNVFRRDVQEDASEEETEETQGSEAQPKDRWWHRKEKIEVASREAEEETKTEQELTEKNEKKKRRFGLGRRSQEASAASIAEDTVPKSPPPAPPSPTPVSPVSVQPTGEEDSPDPGTRKKRFGLGGFFKRKENASSDGGHERDFEEREGTEAHQTQATTPTTVQKTDPEPNQPPKTDAGADADSIDWTSLSKSERRRLRKEMKRQNRAA